ncbi:hypothetical protein M1512_02635 [Patescibacteria group bacterium]|jgi:hypothetical protein|nr:hypothetical protein [Patescibacteria group bacterium]
MYDYGMGKEIEWNNSDLEGMLYGSTSSYTADDEIDIHYELDTDIREIINTQSIDNARLLIEHMPPSFRLGPILIYHPQSSLSDRNIEYGWRFRYSEYNPMLKFAGFLFIDRGITDISTGRSIFGTVYSVDMNSNSIQRKKTGVLPMNDDCLMRVHILLQDAVEVVKNRPVNDLGRQLCKMAAV